MLAEDAEHLRQNVVSKKELKHVLWEEVVTLVKDSPELQTKEIPRNAVPGQKTVRHARVGSRRCRQSN